MSHARNWDDAHLHVPSLNLERPAQDEVCVALGSNIGNRLTYIHRGLDFLSTLQVGSNSMSLSSVYETEPVACPPGSPHFLNAVCVMKCRLEPLQLLLALKNFEKKMGRNLESDRNSPRPLDLDIIYFGSCECSSPELTLPHPRAHTRKFVLLPLAELRPHLLLPGQSMTVVQLLGTLNNAEKLHRVTRQPE